VLDRARRHEYCPPDLPTFDELCDTADEELFSKTVKLSHHILHTLLPTPSTASQNYNLRHRTYSLELPAHTTHLTDCAFITRMLYTCVLAVGIATTRIGELAFCQALINEYCVVLC